MTERSAANSATGSGFAETLAPVAVFIVLNRLGGLRLAVAGATIASVAVLVIRHRRGDRLGLVMPAIAVAVIARGLIGIITDSDTIYFGIGIAAKFIFAVGLAASTLTKRPAADRLAELFLMTTPAMRQHRVWRSTMVIVTLIASLYYLMSGLVEIFLLGRAEAEGYVLIRLAANWPLSMLALGAALLVMHRRLRHIPEVTSGLDLMEQRFQALPRSQKSLKDKYK